jgi:DNA-binding response OmpR family regulator
LLDIQLPGLNGFEVLKTLRALVGADFPVLAITASAMDHDRARILAAGFDAYVAKPVNIRELLATLKNRLEPVSP